MAVNSTDDYVFDNSIFEDYQGNATNNEYGEKGPSDFLEYLTAEDEETNNEWKIIDINHGKELQAEEYDKAKKVFALITTSLIIGVACSLLSDRDFTSSIVEEIHNYGDIDGIKKIVTSMPLHAKILIAGSAASIAAQIRSSIKANNLRGEILPLNDSPTAVDILKINKAIEDGLSKPSGARGRKS